MSTYTQGIYRSSGNNVKSLTLMNKELSNLYKKVMSAPLDTIFNIKYKGYEFDCMPFLITGASYFSDTFRSSLLDSICRLKPANEIIKLNTLKSVNKDLLDCLYPATMDYGTRHLCYYLWEENPRELVRLLINGAAEVYSAIVFNSNLIHYDFSYNVICNTQAFCYYTSLNWLFSFSPLLMKLSMQMLNKLKFKQLYESLCPDESIHFQYIRGSISAKELNKLYFEKSFEDNSSICLREVYSIVTEGNYDGHALTEDEVAIADEIYDLNTRDADYKFNMQLGYCYLFNGTFKKVNKQVEELTEECSKLQGVDTSYKHKLESVKDDLHSVIKENKSLKTEIQDLQSKLNAVKTNQDLLDEIANLKQELADIKSENSQLFSERLSLKHEVSSQKKQIKSLTVRLHRDSNEQCEFSEEITDIDISVGLDEMCEALNSSYVTLVGCDDIGSIDKRFEAHGFKHVSRFDSNKRAIGKCDYCIIFTTRCKHTDVYKAESICRGTNAKLVYANCINFEQLINQIYKEEFNE